MSKDEPYNRRNCIKFSDIPNTINDDKFEETIIEACKDIIINVSETDIETCDESAVYIRRNATDKTQCNESDIPYSQSDSIAK